MKKMIAFILILSCLSSILGFGKNVNLFERLPIADEVCYVTDVALGFAKENVASGDLVFNYCTYEVAKENFDGLQGSVKSVEFSFEKTSVQEILRALNVTQFWESQIDGLRVICGYTSFYDDFVLLDGKKVNLQLVEKDGKLLCGFPVIITGY